MASQVDRYGNPVVSAGLYQLIGTDGTLLRQRPYVKLVSGVTTADNDSQDSTDITVTGGTPGITAAGLAFVQASTAVAEAALLGSTIATSGGVIADGPTASISIAGGSRYTLPTLTQNIVVTIANTGSPLTGEAIMIDVTRSSAFTVTVKDAAAVTLLVVPASTKMSVTSAYDGANFANARAIRVQ